MSEKMICTVFDGKQVWEKAEVVIENGVISSIIGTDMCIDGNGFLMPGLMDGHTHFVNKDQMDEMVKNGVTTTCAVNLPEELVQQSDCLKIWTSRTMALGNVSDGRAYVDREAAQGADYIKIILETPARMAPRTMEYSVLCDIVHCAHDHGLKTAVHAVDVSMVEMAVEAGADILIHVPMKEPFPVELGERIAKQGMAIVPTLTMMEAFANDPKFAHYRPEHYPNAEVAVGLLHSLNVPILTGTDSSTAPFVPKVCHGTSLHHEMELLVKAGLKPLEVLQGATSKMAEVFGLENVGSLAPGYAADLILVEGRPDQRITDSTRIRQIWIDGKPFQKR